MSTMVVPPLLILDLGIFELLLIAVLAVMLFGGDLPDAMRRAGRAVRKLRDLADELARQVEPPADLHPRNLLPPDVRQDLTRDLPARLAPRVRPDAQTSRLRTSSAWRSMNSRRGSTPGPISTLKRWSASTSSSSRTGCSVRVSGFIVDSQSCSAFISPRPL